MKAITTNKENQVKLVQVQTETVQLIRKDKAVLEIEIVKMNQKYRATTVFDALKESVDLDYIDMIITEQFVFKRISDKTFKLYITYRYAKNFSY